MRHDPEFSSSVSQVRFARSVDPSTVVAAGRGARRWGAHLQSPAGGVFFGALLAGLCAAGALLSAAWAAL